MSKTGTGLLAIGLVLGAVTLAVAGSGESVKLTGWIADEWCNKANANADGAACSKSCAEQGAGMVLVSGDKVYPLSDKKLALEHLGHPVVVVGTLADDGKVRVESIEKASEKS